MDDYTRTSFVGGHLEVRDGRAGEPTLLIGYAAVFNEESVIVEADGTWRERIAPGAFQQVIATDDVIAAVNHDMKMVLARSRRGTLKLSTDAHGLRYEVTLPNTLLAKDTIENVRNGNYPGSSFKFEVARDGIRVEQPRTPADLPLVIIERVKMLKDVGPVTFPAYAGTSVSVRSLSAIVSEALTSLASAIPEPLAMRRRLHARVAVERARAWGL